MMLASDDSGEERSSPLDQVLEVGISAMGYADDTYGLGTSLGSLQGALDQTQIWLRLTGQEVNGKKSVSFTTEEVPRDVGLAISGADIPKKEEFRCLGVGIRTRPCAKTGPLLASRIRRAGELLSRTYGVQGDCNRRAEAAATLALATGLYGVEIAPVEARSLQSLETKVMTAVWGCSRKSRAKEILFAVLMKGHRLSPVMRHQASVAAWLTRVARTPGTLQMAVQAIWEASDGNPPPSGPVGRAKRVLTRLGWSPRGCWWRWTVPGLPDPVCLATNSPAEIMHCVRESIREAALRDLENRRLRQFGGMRGRVAKGPVLDYMARLEHPARRSLLMGCLTGAVWTADRAHRRRLRDTPQCPYCAVPGLAEDEDHMQCEAWASVREAPRRKLTMLASRVTTLRQEVRECPPCLRICGLPPQ